MAVPIPHSLIMLAGKEAELVGAEHRQELQRACLLSWSGMVSVMQEIKVSAWVHGLMCYYSSFFFKALMALQCR